MNEFMIKMAIQMAMMALQSMMDNGLVLKIQDLVRNAFNFDVEGEEKKKLVWDDLKNIGGSVGDALADTAPWLVNAVIELTVGDYKSDKERN